MSSSDPNTDLLIRPDWDWTQFMLVTVSVMVIIQARHAPWTVYCWATETDPFLRKNVPPMACYNFDTREQIIILFGRNVTDKVGNQKML